MPLLIRNDIDTVAGTIYGNAAWRDAADLQWGLLFSGDHPRTTVHMCGKWKERMSDTSFNNDMLNQTDVTDVADVLGSPFYQQLIQAANRITKEHVNATFKHAHPFFVQCLKMIPVDSHQILDGVHEGDEKARVILDKYKEWEMDLSPSL
eukprot:ANDGO_08143.mRNA.1 hypothetical protein